MKKTTYTAPATELISGETTQLLAASTNLLFDGEGLGSTTIDPTDDPVTDVDEVLSRMLLDN